MSDLLRSIIDFWRQLDWLLNLVAVVAYFASLLFFLREWLYYRRLRRLRELRPSDGAIAVAIGIGMQVSEDVHHHLRETFGINPDGSSKIPLLMSYDKPGYFSREQLLDIIREVRDKLRELMSIGGIKEVHLFYGGPISVAAALGAIVDNWVPVRWYAHNKTTGEYEYLFTLDVEMVKGI